MINQNNFKVIVPNEAKFIVNKDYAKNLRPTTFYSKYADKLSKHQELRRVRSDIRLSVLGKPIESSLPSAASSARYTGVQKDARHYVRIYSRDRTPWIGYDLRPSFKVRQDPFCARYSEFLVRDI
jgi:hypothetical protein